MKDAKTPATGTDIRKLGRIGDLLEYLACQALNVLKNEHENGPQEPEGIQSHRCELFGGHNSSYKQDFQSVGRR
jgi:hypothetical protein